MKVSIHYAVVLGSSTDDWHLARIIVDDDYGGLEISNVFIASFNNAVDAVAFQRFLAGGGQVEPSQQIREAYEERMARSAARDKPISEPMIAELFTPHRAGDPGPATTIGELFTRLVVDGSVRGYTTPYCTRCHGSGSIDTGNNDLPCHCAAGDAAIFNSGGRQMTGAEIKAGR